ncbi:helix-turn-helix domain-containing protein [Nanoarchaeota archaeon]
MTKKDVEGIVSDAMHKALGVSISELSKDISAKLEKSPLLDYTVDTKVKFKQAKKKFKQEFLRRLLRVSYGNISEVAKRAGVDRRSIHRIVKDAGINVGKIREEMIKPYEVKQKAVGHIVEDVLEKYKTVIHPAKVREVYGKVGDVSKDILDELPEQRLTLKKAEEEFEREYLKRALEECGGNATKCAKKVGLRYETLLRKLKALGIR